jgi:hypothetical protein
MDYSTRISVPAPKPTIKRRKNPPPEGDILKELRQQKVPRLTIPVPS